MAAVATRSVGANCRIHGVDGIAGKCRTINSGSRTKFSWLSECKLVELRRIANSIGSNSGGTKAVLSARILSDISRDVLALSPQGHGRKTNTASHRVLSIDMGIRNLAYCKMLLPAIGDAQTGLPIPVIHEWARVAIAKPHNLEATHENGTNVAPKETFEPAIYAQHAYNLILKLLSSDVPTHILIERQRYRSMGGAAVQEWTVRVNMFEAMLYAVLTTLSERNLWRGSVHPVLPAKVSRFWLGDDFGVVTGGAHNKSVSTKAAKVALIGKWLENGDRFRLEGEVADLAMAYQRRMLGQKQVHRKQNRVTGHSAGDAVFLEVGKLDDLADCLLQAMAWIQWESNRHQFLIRGLQALDTQ